MRMARRFKLLIEYDGRPFAGWQIQANAPSIQAALTKAIHAFTGEQVIVHGAGRTDAGVHANGQVAHVDIEKAISPQRFLGAINHHLKPHPISVLSAEIVGDDFHARFSARRRSYRYEIINRPSRLSFAEGLAWHVSRPLDADAMQEGANHLLGQHDFTTFRHSACQARSPIRTLDLLRVERLDDRLHIHVSALSFLHHQVRSMVGSLELVGAGKWPPIMMKEILEAKDRCALGFNAPPFGLYLTRIDY